MKSTPLALSVNSQYFRNLLDWRNTSYQRVGDLVQVNGFDQYNQLININKIFSSRPSGDPVDRTGSISGPLKFKILRPWTYPTLQKTIEEVFENRVKYYVKQNSRLDLLWSGGTDSTSMVVAFLKHAPDLSQLRLVYSPHSLYENRNFFEFITKKFPKLETIDISGEIYLHRLFNNTLITGHGGDEFTASLDQSFFDEVSSNGLLQNWKDLFWSKTQDQSLIDFCEEYFSKSGRPIDSVLEARWWFYAATKSQVYGPRDISFLFNQRIESTAQFGSFFDCQEFEDYMWHNIDTIIEPNGSYKTYKKFLRQYIYEFDCNKEYLENTAKTNSVQFQLYRYKKIELLDLRWIMFLEDNSIVRTKNLPLLSKKEFDNTYGNSLEYLFNEPH